MKQDAIAHITERYTALTESEKKLADFILLHFSEVIEMSVHELAKASNVSAAAVIRFAKQMGFDGFKKFRYFLIENRPKHQDFIVDLQKSRGTTEEEVSKVINASIEAMRSTAQDLDFNELETIAKKIKNASNILLFGTGTSYIVCQDNALKFQRLGKMSTAICDTHSAAVFLNNLKKDDIVIGISHSGENSDTCKVLKLAQESNITTVAVTTFAGSPICFVSNHILFTKTRESPLHKIAITSRISQFSAMDSLLMAYLVADYENCITNIDKLGNKLTNIN